MPAKAQFPMTMPGGDIMPHMSARNRTRMMDLVFEGSGGFDRLLAFAEKNDENYTVFFKEWAKGAVRSSNVEVGVSEGVENLLDRLDARDKAANAQVINADFTEVFDATPEDTDE